MHNLIRIRHGRYRLKTWCRRNLPDRLSRLFPKGAKDCGRHEFYNSNDLVDRCYHCQVGVRDHAEPMTPDPE